MARDEDTKTLVLTDDSIRKALGHLLSEFSDPKKIPYLKKVAGHSVWTVMRR